MLLHLTESELRNQAAGYRRRAGDVRERAIAMISKTAQRSLLMAAQTWERLAETREIEANLRRDGSIAPATW